MANNIFANGIDLPNINMIALKDTSICLHYLSVCDSCCSPSEMGVSLISLLFSSLLLVASSAS